MECRRRRSCLGDVLIAIFFFFAFFLSAIFLSSSTETETDRERQRHTGRDKQANFRPPEDIIRVEKKDAAPGKVHVVSAIHVYVYKYIPDSPGRDVLPYRAEAIRSRPVNSSAVGTEPVPRFSGVSQGATSHLPAFHGGAEANPPAEAEVVTQPPGGEERRRFSERRAANGGVEHLKEDTRPPILDNAGTFAV